MSSLRLSLSPVCWMFLSALASASPAPQLITAEPGQTVVLPCQITRSTPVLAIEWTRADLGEEYVLFYRDGQFDPENQHPFFQDRVGLKQKKPEDASLILRNVTNGDGGQYECHVLHKGTQRRKRASFNSEQVKIIELSVGPGHSDSKAGNGQVGMAVGLSVAGIAVLAVVIAVVVVMLRKRRASEPKPNQSPTDDAVELQLIHTV